MFLSVVRNIHSHNFWSLVHRASSIATTQTLPVAPIFEYCFLMLLSITLYRLAFGWLWPTRVHASPVVRRASWSWIPRIFNFLCLDRSNVKHFRDTSSVDSKRSIYHVISLGFSSSSGFLTGVALWCGKKGGQSGSGAPMLQLIFLPILYFATGPIHFEGSTSQCFRSFTWSSLTVISFTGLPVLLHWTMPIWTVAYSWRHSSVVWYYVPLHHYPPPHCVTQHHCPRVSW